MKEIRKFYPLIDNRVTSEAKEEGRDMALIANEDDYLKEEPSFGREFWWLDIFSDLHKGYFDPMNEHHIRLFKIHNVFLNPEEARKREIRIAEK